MSQWNTIKSVVYSMKMKAVYIVNDLKVAKILVDPMRRAILDLLRQRPMTQAQLAHELGLTGASLNYHIKNSPEAINRLSERLARLLVRISKNYERKEVDSSNEEIVYEIYTKAITALIKQDIIEVRQ